MNAQSVATPLLNIRKFILLKSHINVRTVENPLLMVYNLTNTRMFRSVRKPFKLKKFGKPTPAAHNLYNISKFMLVQSHVSVSNKGRLLYGLHIMIGLRKQEDKECGKIFLCDSEFEST